MSRTLSCVIFISILAVNDCANILAVFPAPSISHQVVFRPITQELARRGHSVTVVTADPVFNDKPFPNLTEIDLHDLSYSFKDEIYALSENDQTSQYDVMFHLFYKFFEAQIQDKSFKKLLNDKTKKFDVLLIEACFFNALAVSHVFKAPVIWVSSLGTVDPNNYVIGSASHPVFYPSSLLTRSFNHTFWERLTAIYNQYRLNQVIEKYIDLNDVMLKKHFDPEIPSLRELANNVHLTMLNVHSIWENNRPTPPNVIYLGGLPKKADSELPQDLKTYLDSSKHGVIYMSFGTNVSPSLLPPEKVQIFVKVFSKLPYDVLWKWDKESIPGQSKNIRVGKWFPQSDLLKHPNIKLFITQGGLQSTDETILAGVPTIGIPMLGDQRYNVDQYVKLGIGKYLDLDIITEDNFMDAIRTIIDDKSYRQNIISLREIMYDQPQTALERAIFWIEYVIKHKGARHLRAPAANLPWYTYFQLDIVIFVFSLVMIAVCLVIFLLNFLLKSIFGGNKWIKKAYAVDWALKYQLRQAAIIFSMYPEQTLKSENLLDGLDLSALAS